MDLLGQMKVMLNEQFNQQQVNQTGKFAPRKGYYIIKSIEYPELGINKVETPVANVNWKLTVGEPFLEEAIFQIALSSLFKDRSWTANEIHDLIGKPFFIWYCGLPQVTLNSPKPRLEIKWGFLYSPQSFINASTIAAYLFFGNKQLLSDAWNCHSETANYDVNESIEYEVTASNTLAFDVCELIEEIYTEEHDYFDYDGLEDTCDQSGSSSHE